MKRPFSPLAAGAVLLAAALIALPLILYDYEDQETLTLNDAVRNKAPGKFVRIWDGITHYELGGPPGGTPVLLISDFSAPYTIWDPTFNALTKAGLRTLRFDAFGRGLSDRPLSPYDEDFFEKQISDLLDILGIRVPVDIAGISMGASLAVTFANWHPERVRRLLLIDPNYSTGHLLPLQLTIPVVRRFDMAIAVAPRLPRTEMAAFVHPQRFPHYLDAYRQQMRYQGFRRALLSTLTNYCSQDVTTNYEQLGKSRKPVLLIWGKADKEQPIALATQVRLAIPQAEFYPIDDAGALPHWEHPEIVDPLILDFLGRP